MPNDLAPKATGESVERIATLLECNQYAIAGDISWLTSPSAALIRAQVAEIERLRAALERIGHDPECCNRARYMSGEALLHAE